MSKPTPGPWKVEECADDPEYPWVFHVEAHAVTIAGVNGIGWGEAEANARLISAAPQMLQALEELIAECKNDYHNPTTFGFDLAVTAIAKATGESRD